MIDRVTTFVLYTTLLSLFTSVTAEVANSSHGFRALHKEPLTELDIIIKEVEWAEAAFRRRGFQQPEKVHHWTLQRLFDDLLAVSD